MKQYLYLGTAFMLLITQACSSPEKQSSETTADSTGTEKVQADTLATAVSIDTAIVAIAKKYLQTTYKQDLEKSIIDDNSRRFKVSAADLNGDGIDEIFIGHTGGYFCGSGGCTIELVDSKGKKITKFTVSDSPVVIDKTKQNGWSDLLIQSKGKYRTLSFNGKTYPSNPSIAPATSSEPDASLKRLLEESDGTWYNF